MRVWTIIANFIFVIVVSDKRRTAVGTMSSPPEEFDRELSPSTMLALTNLSTAIRQFDAQEAESRRVYYEIQSTNTYREHPQLWNTKERLCYMMHSTYQSAMQDLRAYFDIRYLYVDNLEYEMGFISYEIISKYQNIIELYHLVERRYIRANHTNVAASNYLLYIYTNIVQLSYAVINLCNMMYELEKKYSFSKPSLFDDYHVSRPQSGASGKQSKQSYADRIQEYSKQVAKAARKRRKDKKKEMEAALAQGFTPVFVRTKPKRSKHWERIYGWSIEDGW